MGEWCTNCGRVMKYQELTHCSDECLMEEIKQSKAETSFKRAKEFSFEMEKILTRI